MMTLGIAGRRVLRRSVALVLAASKKLVRMGLAVVAVAGLLILAPGVAHADGECQWVNREGELNTYPEGHYLNIQFDDGSWETWRCVNGSWEHVPQEQ
jgi:hypothetical protein